MRVLIVEDDEVVKDAVRRSLGLSGYKIDTASTREEALRAVDRVEYDTVVLDLGLPDGDGYDVLKRLRERTQLCGCIVVSAHDDVEQRVKCLDLGADDFMGKPFSLAELEARIRRTVRARVSGGVVGRIGRLDYNLAQKSATVDGDAVEWTARDWQLFEYLIVHKDELVSRERLATALTAEGESLSPNAVEVTICRLRQKLQDSGVTIYNARGLGYRLVETSA